MYFLEIDRFNKILAALDGIVEFNKINSHGKKTVIPLILVKQHQGRIWRAFRAFPGRPWRRTQDSVGHKTDDKREKKKEKK